MPRVCIMEFQKDTRVFKILQEADLASIPTAGDKITLNLEDGVGYIFKVYDVHYTDNERTDVNVIRLSNITNYNSSKFPDITLDK
jgi:hypothetical protein